MPVQLTCQKCSSTYDVKPSQVQRSSYCSKKCMYKANGENVAWRNRTQALSAEVRLLRNTICDLSTGCWIWTGERNAKGYGQVRLFSNDAKWTTVHRLSYQTFVGQIPGNLWVLHRCDNPPCIRPDHLWLGTVADNNRDMWTKHHRLPMSKPAHGEPISAGRRINSDALKLQTMRRKKGRTRQHVD